MKDNKRILVADHTGQILHVSIPGTNCLSLNKADNPDLFKNYDVIWLTAYNPDMSESVFSVLDYINGSGKNPLMGKNREDLGLRFPDMSYVFKEIKSRKIPSVVVTAGNIENPDSRTVHIRCDLMVWNAILAAHQKKTIYGLFFKDIKEAESLIAAEMKDL